MEITGLQDTDIELDSFGQPVPDVLGEASIIYGDSCWFQDLGNEVLTEPGELFYEDEKGISSYGWGLFEFLQKEQDEFTELEIRQLIKNKLTKRSYINPDTIKVSIQTDGHDYDINVSFQKQGEGDIYSMAIAADGKEINID